MSSSLFLALFSPLFTLFLPSSLPQTEEPEDEPAEIPQAPATTGEAAAGAVGTGAPGEQPKKIVRKKKKLPEQFVDVAPDVEPSQDGWQWRKYVLALVSSAKHLCSLFKCSTPAAAAL
jgi:hypothetical protein